LNLNNLFAIARSEATRQSGDLNAPPKADEAGAGLLRVALAMTRIRRTVFSFKFSCRFFSFYVIIINRKRKRYPHG